MVTMAQRIEALRTEAGMSRPALAAALGFSKGAFEKFESGRQTPSREQQEQLAAYFGVSLFYLRGESNDRTRQGDWMDQPEYNLEPKAAAPVPPQSVKRSKAEPSQQSTVMDALLGGRQIQDLLQKAVLEALKSPEGKALLAEAVRKELDRRP